MVAKQQAQPSPEDHSQHAEALEALECARAMPPGPQRIEALKKAGLLRRAVDSEDLTFAKRGRPRR
jgi:hypothetical protein